MRHHHQIGLLPEPERRTELALDMARRRVARPVTAAGSHPGPGARPATAPSPGVRAASALRGPVDHVGELDRP